MILLIDNYDSFVHNLARYFERLGQETRVVRNDAIDTAQIRKLEPAAVVLSPGPRRPENAGRSLEIVRELGVDAPLLGVCLGHQIIAAAWGAQIARAAAPMHGRTSSIEHNELDIFRSVPRPLTVCRYHSLIVQRETLPAEFIVSAETAEGEIMAIQHRTAPLYGLQFHPEAILTDSGYLLLANFLQQAGVAIPAELPQNENLDSRDAEAPEDSALWPANGQHLYRRGE